MLQFKEERDAFAEVIMCIDNLLGMEILLNARTPVVGTKIPNVAQRARNRAKAALAAIMAFSNEKRPSTTKLSTMQSISDGLVETVDEIIKGMHTTIAAAPIIEKQ